MPDNSEIVVDVTRKPQNEAAHDSGGCNVIRDVPEWLIRVTQEKAELDGRIERLKAALHNPSMAIPLVQRDLMTRQLGYMQAYSCTLRDRIEAGNQPD